MLSIKIKSKHDLHFLLFLTALEEELRASHVRNISETSISTFNTRVQILYFRDLIPSLNGRQTIQTYNVQKSSCSYRGK